MAGGGGEGAFLIKSLKKNYTHKTNLLYPRGRRDTILKELQTHKDTE